MAPSQPAPSAFSARQADEVPGRRHAPRTRRAGARSSQEQRRQPLDVGPRQHAVAGHRRRHDGTDRLVRPQLEQLGHRPARARAAIRAPAPRPPRRRPPGSRARRPPVRASAGRSAPPARDPPVRPSPTPPAPPRTRAARRRPPPCGRPRRTARRRRRRRPGGRSGQRRALVGHAGAGRVEVDHVDPAGAPRDVTLRQRRPGRRSAARGRSRPGSGGRPPPPRRSMAGSRSIIRAEATKLASSARPVAPDFSGWNWAPHSVPRAASAATGPP